MRHEGSAFRLVLLAAATLACRTSAPAVAPSTALPEQPISRPRRSCPSQDFRVPNVGELPPIITVRFALMKDGRIEQFAPLTPGVPAPVLEAIRDNFMKCTWTPARDATGRPVNTWATVPVHTGQGAPGGR